VQNASIFLLAPPVKLAKRLDLDGAGERALDSVPGLIVAKGVEESTKSLRYRVEPCFVSIVDSSDPLGSSAQFGCRPDQNSSRLQIFGDLIGPPLAICAGQGSRPDGAGRPR